VLGVVAGIYRVARKRGYVSRSPLDGLDEAERPRPKVGAGRVLDEQQLAQLVAKAPNNYRAAVTLLAYSGLRLSEACGLRWSDVDLVEGELTVRRQLEAGRGERQTAVVERLKSRASYRTVPIFPALERELVALLEDELAQGRGGPGNLVLSTRRGRPVSPRNVAQRGVMKAATNAALGHVTPQDLRRSFCSLAGRRGLDPVEAPQLTGHSPEVWARYYARSFGKAQRDEARARMLEYGFGAVRDAELAADSDEVR
jgi:integrase